MRAEKVAGRYELVEEIGFGAMGQVWRGYDAVLDREVAVKLILPSLIPTAEQAEVLARRFRREARITARINHPGVPQVYDAVLDRDFSRVHIVMELVQGTPLGQFIDDNQPMPIESAVSIAAQICVALSHAHAIPAVHRDLKPGNIIIARDGTVKVLDFGIAAVLHADATKLTATGVQLGTARYMSPEQIQAVQVSPQSDLYGHGCILYELLTGTSVFPEDARLLQRHLFEPPPPLRRLRPDIPAELEALTMDLLEKLPENRPTDAQAVFERLSPFLPTRGSRAPQDRESPDPTRPYRNPCAPRRRPDQPTGEPVSLVSMSTRETTEAIKAAMRQSEELLAEDRFAQAADVLQAVIPPAAEAFGADNPRVLRLRRHRAAVQVIGGDIRRALTEFDRLADAFGRVAGPYTEDTLECRRHAALCRAQLGQGTTALDELRQVLARVKDLKGDGDETVLDVRRDIGSLLATEGHTDDAITVLQPLHQDMVILYGPQDPRTLEVHDLLNRLKAS